MGEMMYFDKHTETIALNNRAISFLDTNVFVQPHELNKFTKRLMRINKANRWKDAIKRRK